MRTRPRANAFINEESGCWPLRIVIMGEDREFPRSCGESITLGKNPSLEADMCYLCRGHHGQRREDTQKPPPRL